MIVVVGATKGGVGKTTIALNLAIGRALEPNRKVWLVDGDRQATALTAIGSRSEATVEPMIAASLYCDGRDLRTQVKQQQVNFHDIIVDVGGRDSSSLRAALLIADVLVIPFLPRTYDVWALDDIAGLMRDANMLRDSPVRVVTVLNQSDPSGTDNIDAERAAQSIDGLDLPPIRIGRRKAFANAGGSGLSVVEAMPRDHKAIAEVQQLLRAVFVGNEMTMKEQ